jgi:CBS domain-containing protein
LLNELPKLVGEVTEAQIITAAASLRPDSRAVVEVLPGAAQ